MSIKTTLTVLFVFITAILYCQVNKKISLVSQVSFDKRANDVWGFTSEDGKEFAIIGTISHTRIIDITEPSQPKEILAVEGANSTWRDFKSWGNYIYGIADQGSDGLLIIDMSDIGDTIPFSYIKPAIALDTSEFPLLRCHNLFIDNDGYLYLAGCNIGKGGVIVMDLKTNPTDPVQAGIENFDYAHDVFVQDSLMFASEIYKGRAAIYDISDKKNIKLINTQNTGFRFTHNIWASSDGKSMFTTDERTNAYLESYDISNLNEIRFLDGFRPYENIDRMAIPHNTHYHNGYLYTSWYTEGVIILDAHKPDNLVKVEQYDTYGGPDGGFHGNWGAYPFLPSGLLLLSDIESGLFVLEPDLQRASYIEGIITDEETGFPIHNVRVEILNHDILPELSRPNGLYKTGLPGSSLIRIEYSHPEYRGKIIQLQTTEGKVLETNVTLKKKNLVMLTGHVYSESDFAPLPDVQVQIQGDGEAYETVSDGSGNFELEIFDGTYDIYLGQWGYQQILMQKFDLLSNRDLSVGMPKTYADDFIFDFGWQTSGTATSGFWVRGIPEGTFFEGFPANMPGDLPEDLGEYCYMTGNGGGNPGTDDVDNGTVELSSPVFDLGEYQDPVLQYSIWFFNAGGSSPPNDSLIAMISNFQDTVVLEVFRDKESNSSYWRTREVPLTGIIELTDSMQFIVRTSDDSLFHVVEAGLDGFQIRDGSTVSIGNPMETDLDLRIYPNPTYGELWLDLAETNGIEILKITVAGLDGRKYFSLVPRSDILNRITLPEDMPPGMYILVIQTDQSDLPITTKIIKI